MSKIAFLEGLSCSGKSTLLKSIASERYVPVYKDWSNPQSSLEYFLNRDEDKLARAKQVSQNSIALVDRGYLSTITFYHVLQEQRQVPVYPVLQWFIENLGETLYRPDLYIFVDVEPEVSIKRAQTCRTNVDNNMWLHFPERIQYWYQKLYEVFEGGTPKYHLDGTKPTSELKPQLIDILEA